MTSLQQIIYKKLPPSLIQQIINDPNSFPQYAEVISRLNNEILQQHATNIRSKIKFTRKKLELMSLLFDIYYHIKSHPPQLYTGRSNKSLRAWEDFSHHDYPQYEMYIEYVDIWPKHLFLIYYTYKLSYETFYNLKLDILLKKHVLPFNRKKTPFINFIYNTFQYLNHNISLKQFRDFGY